MAALSRSEQEQLYTLLMEQQRREHVNRYRKFFGRLYDWQKEFIESTRDFSQVALIAANRIGKTWTGTYMDACHAMGEYPDDWPGHKFSHAPLIWCLGYSGEKTRDLLQAAIVGRKDGDQFIGGLIPMEKIAGYESMSGTPNALRTCFVRHSSGALSRIQFWSYSQGQHALMGDGVDWFHIDEEPEDPEIYPQVLVRTATGDHGAGGRGILTLTPENGRTDLVISFMDNPGPGQKYMQKGWDDAPHLSDKVKTELLEAFPAHQREMRTKGVPMLGHGRIYDMAEEDITCPSFDIPPHWFVIDGMDFGWDHPQAQIQLVEDRDNGMFYVVRAWKQRLSKPSDAWSSTKSWSENAPTAWPADGLNHEKGSAKQQKAYYEEEGFNMLQDHAQWPDKGNGVEAGINEIRNLMLNGKFKVFAGLRAFFDEFLQYHRDSNGDITKVQDDVLDAVRYAYMMRRFAINYGDLGKKWGSGSLKIPVYNNA